jgi:hypothetical protein
MNDLLTTEASRRRVRMEIERGASPGAAGRCDRPRRLPQIRRHEDGEAEARDREEERSSGPAEAAGGGRRRSRSGRPGSATPTAAGSCPSSRSAGTSSAGRRVPAAAGRPDAGRPWRYTDEQARFILWWFAIDEHGRFVYRYGMLRRVKGWGKDPVGATLCATEFVGPCRFAGWDADGDPVARRTRPRGC